MRYAVINGNRYIGAYHPSQRTISENDYAQGIIGVVKKNAAKIA
jgi:hypothetical protein